MTAGEWQKEERGVVATQSYDKLIVLSGGGTGGHITPILAVAHELKRVNPTVKLVYVGERGGQFKDLTENHPAIDENYTIFAGKFRRYNGEKWFNRLLDFRTNLLNIRDLVYVIIGIIQAQWILYKLKPDSVFLKGGFVGVPVGLASALQKIPFMTHDSDAIPGLANKLVSRWAKMHAVAGEIASYNYPAEKTIQVGVLVEPDFKYVDKELQAQYKNKIDIKETDRLLVITGGSVGAQNINMAILQIAEGLLSDYDNLCIVHQTGRGKKGIYGNFKHPRLRVVEFMRPMYAYTGAADVVVCRSSGSTLAELGTQGKAVITIPNPLLAGGHQLENARRLADMNAVVVVDENDQATDESQLDNAIRELLNDKEQSVLLSKNLLKATMSGATEKIARYLIEIQNNAKYEK